MSRVGRTRKIGPCWDKNMSDVDEKFLVMIKKAVPDGYKALLNLPYDKKLKMLIEKSMKKETNNDDIINEIFTEQSDYDARKLDMVSAALRGASEQDLVKIILRGGMARFVELSKENEIAFGNRQYDFDRSVLSCLWGSLTVQTKECSGYSYCINEKDVLDFVIRT
eukprot:UN30293